MARWIAPIIVVALVLGVGLLLWWPPEGDANRSSDLGAALIGGAVAAIAVLYLQWRMSIELSKQQRIHDAQFNQYFELWSQLQKLRQEANDLWDKELSPSKLSRFAQRLVETRSAVEEGKLVLEAEHYSQLLSLLERFRDFEAGKSTLLDMRKAVAEIGAGRLSEARTTLQYDPGHEHTIREQIDNNRMYKEAYEQLLDQIEGDIRAQLEIERDARAAGTVKLRGKKTVNKSSWTKV